MRMKISLFTMSLFLICFIGCGTRETQNEVGIQYTLINEEKTDFIKTSIDIRLNSEVNEETITKIANELRNDGRSKYQRIFINYYLPEMEVGKGAWALSHFNPDLEVKILGLSKSEKDQLLEETVPMESTVIGKWVDNSIGSPGVYTISRIEDLLTISVKYRDGSGHTKKLIEKTVKSEKRWTEEGNQFGEYYVLHNDGTLGIYDPEGLYKTLQKKK